MGGIATELVPAFAVGQHARLTYSIITSTSGGFEFMFHGEVIEITGVSANGTTRYHITALGSPVTAWVTEDALEAIQ